VTGVYDARHNLNWRFHLVETHSPHSLEMVIGMGHTTTTEPTTARVADALSFQTPTRLVVAPHGGVFEPASNIGHGTKIAAGQVVGYLTTGANRTPVTSPFAGRSGEPLAWAGERLVPHQPVMWLSVDAPPV